LCPFAYFSIIPYWLSFKQGAQFRWRKNKDDVVCQCPKKDGVVFLVRRQPKNGEAKVSAEVSLVGECPHQHQKGQIFEISNIALSPGEFPAFWISWNKTAAGGPKDIDQGVCVEGFKAPCLFYKRKGEAFSLKEMLPKGLCPDLFFQIYPQYLSLLYGGQRPQTSGVFIHRCQDGSTYQCRIYKKKFFLAGLIDLIWTVFAWCGEHKDLVNGKIIIECAKSTDAKAACCSAGKDFSFNHYAPLWGQRFFCPAVYYTMYPFLQCGGAPVFQCPADNAAITFKIKETP